ncbi:hypothetical protein PanWU01x14_369370 [Parasponia andersonii]|uniref:Uncharacterized protein n=1 Tax=Parasponia andersonii TaxID=3476 RepID=A0A2P5A4Q6_PARAD|nr:hypothetical protein PanWU01x14_369370 [Parasponia andersonii]
MEGLDGKDYMLYGTWLKACCDIPNCLTKQLQPQAYVFNTEPTPEPTPCGSRSSQLHIVGLNVYKSPHCFVPAIIRPLLALPSPQTPPPSPEISLAKKPDQSSECISSFLTHKRQPGPPLLKPASPSATKYKTQTNTISSPNIVPTILSLLSSEKFVIPSLVLVMLSPPHLHPLQDCFVVSLI